VENEDTESQSSAILSGLPVLMKESYATGETDGVQTALKSNSILSILLANLNSEEVASFLIDAAIEAAGKDRGGLAAILNSILASCCETEGGTANPQISLAILNGMDKRNSVDETSMVTPDLVSLSLVYYAHYQSLKANGGKELEIASQTILERSQKIAKKAAGSQRRKELNMARRRGANSNEIDSKQTERNLQSLYGPDFRILHETSDVIVISKPAGMVCYHSKRTGAGKISSSRKKKIRASNENDSDTEAKWMDISIVDALIDCSVSLSTLNPSARGVVHRLDRGTSGSLILAKSDHIHLILTALFFLRKVEKKYLALVPGCKSTNHDAIRTEDENMKQISDDTLSLGSTGVIDAPVDGRPARSTFRVVKEYWNETQSRLPNALLLEVATLTGRKHQVRVHCASLGHPILFDPLYSASSNTSSSKKGQTKRYCLSPTLKEEMDNSIITKAFSDLLLLDNSQQKQQERFFLHAASLSIDELGISVNAPLPKWWADFMEQLEKCSAN
jgi:23S rRNA-/tRNA-specific pseudouridylate synthase